MNYEQLHKEALAIANEETFNLCGPVKLKYDVMENGETHGTDVTPGYCGFASIKSKSLKHPFIKYLLEIGFMKVSESEKGIAYYWVNIYSQSYEHKKTFARAYTQYIKDSINTENVDLYFESRLD